MIISYDWTDGAGSFSTVSAAGESAADSTEVAGRCLHTLRSFADVCNRLLNT